MKLSEEDVERIAEAVAKKMTPKPQPIVLKIDSAAPMYTAPGFPRPGYQGWWTIT